MKEYNGLDNQYCVVNKNYVYLYNDDGLLERIKLITPIDVPSKGIVDNDNIRIIINGDEIFAQYNDTDKDCYNHYRNLCICEIDGETYDFTGEFDTYLNECHNAQEAYLAVYDEFINK